MVKRGRKPANQLPLIKSNYSIIIFILLYAILLASILYLLYLNYYYDFSDYQSIKNTIQILFSKYLTIIAILLILIYALGLIGNNKYHIILLCLVILLVSYDSYCKSVKIKQSIYYFDTFINNIDWMIKNNKIRKIDYDHKKAGDYSSIINIFNNYLETIDYIDSHLQRPKDEINLNYIIFNAVINNHIAKTEAELVNFKNIAITGMNVITNGNERLMKNINEMDTRNIRFNVGLALLLINENQNEAKKEISLFIEAIDHSFELLNLFNNNINNYYIEKDHVFFKHKNLVEKYDYHFNKILILCHEIKQLQLNRRNFYKFKQNDILNNIDKLKNLFIIFP